LPEGEVVSIRKSLGKLFLFSVLQIGALAGVPMTAEDIEKIMEVMHRTKVEFVVKNEESED
jgi:hypothetical protein